MNLIGCLEGFQPYDFQYEFYGQNLNWEQSSAFMEEDSNIHSGSTKLMHKWNLLLAAMVGVKEIILH